MALFWVAIWKDSFSLWRFPVFSHVQNFSNGILLICCLLLFKPLEFFTSALADGLSLEFEWQQVSSSLQDSSQYSGRSQQRCRMVSTRPPTSKFSSPFNSPLVIVPNALITIGIIATFKFHRFFKFPSKVEVLNLLFTFFHFYSVVSR